MVIVTGTATFAWLKLNPNAWFDEMQIDVSSNEDVEISVDGVRWTHNLSKRDVMLGIISVVGFFENIVYIFFDKRLFRRIISIIFAIIAFFLGNLRSRCLIISSENE